MKMIQNTYETLVFNDPSQLPEGAIKLTVLTKSHPEQCAVRQAMVKGRIQGYKIVKSLKDLQSGSLYVDAAHGKHYLQGYRKAKAKTANSGKEPVVSKEQEPVQMTLPADDGLAGLLRELLTVQKQTLTRLNSIDEFCTNSAINFAHFIEEARMANRQAPSVSNGTHEFSLNSR